MLTSYTTLKKYNKKPPAFIEAERDCIWNFNANNGGYPTVDFQGKRGDYVCPSMFRDLSDYVVSWPFDHFHENVRTWNPETVTTILPPVSDSS